MIQRLLLLAGVLVVSACSPAVHPRDGTCVDLHDWPSSYDARPYCLLQDSQDRFNEDIRNALAPAKDAHDLSRR